MARLMRSSSNFWPRLRASGSDMTELRDGALISPNATNCFKGLRSGCNACPDFVLVSWLGRPCRLASGLLAQLLDAACHAFPIVEGAGGDAAEIGFHRIAGGVALVASASLAGAAAAGEAVAAEAGAME